MMQNTESKDNSKIIAIIGSWGTGKSTVRKILGEIISNPMKLESLKKQHENNNVSFSNAEAIYEKFATAVSNKDNNHNELVGSIVTTYEAMQFEEPSQVTSELYNNIANTILQQGKLRFKWYDPSSAYRKFRSIAYLKKESFASNISTTHIILLFKFIIFSVIGKLIIDTIISALEVSDPLFAVTNFIGALWGIDVHVFYSLLIYLPLAGLVLAKADIILRVITGFLARASHVDILKSISLDQPLFLLIDEIDRLSPEAVKLLFDEVLILKEAWKNKKQDLTIFMFYDENVVLHQHKELHTYEPHIFLQKFYDDFYKLNKVSFFDELVNAINKMMAADLFDKFLTSYPHGEIIHIISSNISSFRMHDKFIAFCWDQIKKYNDDPTYHYVAYNTDFFIFNISLKFFFNLDSLAQDTSAKIYSNYLNTGISKLKDLYSLTDQEIKNHINEGLYIFIEPSCIDGEFEVFEGIVFKSLSSPVVNIYEYCNMIARHISYIWWSEAQSGFSKTFYEQNLSIFFYF